MRIVLLHQSYPEFELPDEWGIAAARTAAQGKQSYDTAEQNELVELTAIAIPERKRMGGPFDPERMRAILGAIASGQSLPPIDVDQPPLATGQTFRLRDGFHRYFASVAVGLFAVPVRVLPYFGSFAGEGGT